MLVRKFMSKGQKASKQLFWEEEQGGENWDVILQGKMESCVWVIPLQIPV